MRHVKPAPALKAVTYDDTAPLRTLRERFLATSTISMPLAGMIVWAALGIAGSSSRAA